MGLFENGCNIYHLTLETNYDKSILTVNWLTCHKSYSTSAFPLFNSKKNRERREKNTFIHDK